MTNRILVAEDDELMRNYLGRVFSESPLKSGHFEESIYLLKEVYPWQ
jgi:hypothetical protein